MTRPRDTDMIASDRRGAEPNPLAAGVALCVVAAVLHALWYWPTVVDDAFITFRYALNSVNGGGLSFNPGGPVVEGSSSPLWTGLAAIALRAGVHDLLFAAKLFGLALHALTTVLVWKLAGGADERRRWPALLAPIAWALQPFAAYHAVSGMETPLAPALLALATLALLDLARHPARGAIGIGACLGLLSWARPEGFGYAVALLAAGAWLHAGERRARNALAAAAGLWLAAHAALLGWRWSTFHAFVPNTAVAKALGPDGPAPWWRGIDYVARYFSHQRVPADVLVALGLLVLLLRRGGRRELVLAVPVVAAIAFCIAVKGDWIHSFRFLVPAIPFLCALLARGAIAAVPARGPHAPLPRAVLVAAGLVVALFLGQDAMLATARPTNPGVTRGWKPASWPLAIPSRVAAGFESRLPGVTRWSIEELPRGARLATGDIGFPAWASGARVLDLVGLTDATLARAVPRGDTAAFGAYLREEPPDAIVLRTTAGKPVTRYDRMLVGSGVLAGDVPTDSVSTYGSSALAVIWRRPGLVTPSPHEVLERYAWAREWNPRVHDLVSWEADFRARHAAAR